jgi:Arc/MetJ-type ribon-helix-helix transcriptional regulator
MARLTVTLSDELAEFIEEESGDDGEFESKSAAVRHYIERGQDAEDLENEVEVLEARLDDLRRQLYERDDVEEKVDILAKRLEETQQARQAADAPFFVRWGRWASRRWRGSSATQDGESSA